MTIDYIQSVYSSLNNQKQQYKFKVDWKKKNCLQIENIFILFFFFIIKFNVLDFVGSNRKIILKKIYLN